MCLLCVQSRAVVNAKHCFHVPRAFFERNYNAEQVLQSGMTIRIVANGKLDPEVGTALSGRVAQGASPVVT